MTFAPSAHLPVRFSPAVDQLSFEEGVAVVLPDPNPPKVFDWTDSAMGYTKGKLGSILEAGQAADDLDDMAKAWNEGQRGVSVARGVSGATRLAVLTPANAVKSGASFLKPFASNPRDAQTLDRISYGADVLIGCGGAALTWLAAGATAGGGGVLVVAAALQTVGCMKSVMDLLSLGADGKTGFDRDRELSWWGMGLETAGLLGSVLTLGASAALKAGARLTTRRFGLSMLGRGKAAVGALDRWASGLDLFGLGLKGVKNVLWPAPDGALTPVPATPDKVETLLDLAGLRRSVCFYPWPIQTDSLLGRCEPWER